MIPNTNSDYESTIKVYITGIKQIAVNMTSFENFER